MKRVKLNSVYKSSNAKNEAQPKQQKIPNRSKKSEKSKPHQSRFRLPGIKKLLVMGIAIALVFFVFRFWQGASRNLITDKDGNVLAGCTNILNPDCWSSNVKPQLRKIDNVTNALVVGLDTRAEGYGTDLQNTDSIMVVSFDHDTKITTMISIPRDFYVSEYSSRINSLYTIGKQRDSDAPHLLLKSEVEKIIGQPIQYVGTVRFEGVEQLVQEVGGIELCIDKAFTAKYPQGLDYVYLDYAAGCQTLDGYHALAYARFRTITRGPAVLASDYSRVRRQQEVLDAIKNKALAQDLSVKDRIELYKNMYDGLSALITVDIGVEDIAAAVSLIDGADLEPINIVLDPYFGGQNKILKENNRYELIPVDGSYAALNDELKNIRNNVYFYAEQPEIVVLNYTGEALLPDNFVNRLLDNAHYLKKYDIINQLADGTEPAGINIVDTTGQYRRSTQYLSNALNASVLNAGDSILPASVNGKLVIIINN